MNREQPWMDLTISQRDGSFSDITLIRRQQGGESIMIWAGIINDQIVNLVRVPEEVKLTSMAYCNLFGSVLMNWLEYVHCLIERRSKPIKILLVFIKRTVYACIRQFSSNADLWKSVQDAVGSVEPSIIKKITESVTERQF